MVKGSDRTLKIVIVVCLLVIIGLSIILYMSRHRKPAVQPTRKNAVNSTGQYVGEGPNVYLDQPVVVGDSPYFYDTGYWLDPWAWWGWGGDNYYTTNVYNSNGGNGDGHHGGGGNPSTTSATPSPTVAPIPTMAPLPTLGPITPTIGNSLPTVEIIAPSSDSVFPIPTLAIPQMQPLPPQPEQPIPNPLPPVEMPMNKLPIMPMQRAMDGQHVTPNGQAPPVNQLSGQAIGMHGGNVHLQPQVPQMPQIPQMQQRIKQV